MTRSLPRHAPPTRAARRRATLAPKPTPRWRSPIVLVSAAGLLVGVVLIALAVRPAPAGGSLIEPPTSYASVTASGTTLGRADAPVLIELYADFQCPACKAFVTTELGRLVSDFVVPGMVRIEAKDLDFIGKGSFDESLELAAGAACAADQNAYWTFHDLVFWNQGRENRGDHDQAFIADVAARAGLDMAAWRTCLEQPSLRAGIHERTRTASVAGISATPTLVINGRVAVGVPEYAALAAAIRQLASAAP